MTSVIDSLSIKLGLDVGDYKKGQKEVTDSQKALREASTATSKEMETGQKKVTEGLTALKVGLLEVVAIFAAGVGLKDFVVGTMESQASLGRLSTNLNMNAKDLKAWQIVVKEMGGSADDANGSFMALQQGIGEAMATGHSSFTDNAKKMGVNITPEMIKDQDYAGIMGAIAKRLQSLPRPLAQYDAGQLGVGSMFNVLMDKNLSSNLAHAKTLTGETQESVEAAERLQKSWVDFGAEVDKVKNQIWIKIEPIIERLGNQFMAWLEKVDWEALIDKIGRTFDKINNVVQAFGGWKDVLIVLGGVLALQLLSPLTSVIGLFTKLIPLLTTTTGGFLALAAAAGAGIGTAIYKASEGTGLGDFFGNVAAGGIALVSQDTRDAIATQGAGDRALARNVTPLHKNSISEQITALDPRAAATAASGGADPTHSHAFSTNAELFSSLEDRFGLPAGLMQRMYMQESGGGKHLLSGSGAKGPFQFMDGTASDYGLNSNTINDLDSSAAAAARYLAKLRSMFGGDMAKAVAAYNWGPGNVQKNGLGSLPTETSNYLANVLPSAARRPGAAVGNSSTSEVSIGTLNVNAPQATDARGIAMAMRTQMQAVPLFAQVDTGVE
jgi:hypothetical protein